MATPHIKAQNGEVAKSILLPGDPLRAKFIAERFLENPVLFNDVRGILGYTGVYKGRRISVMGTGMGIPSISIYANELFSQYGVENAVRIGTCGGMLEGMKLGDVLMAEGCSTDSDINRRIFNGSYCPIADFELLRTADKKARELGKTVYIGNILSSDSFYALSEDARSDIWKRFGIIGVEMEGAGLYTAAKRYGKRALMLCTVSDGPGGEEMTAKEREQSLLDMISVALDTVWEFSE